MTAFKWFAVASAILITAMISFFQINSYWADQHNFNGWIGWKGVGSVLALIGIYIMYFKVIKKSN